MYSNDFKFECSMHLAEKPSFSNPLVIIAEKGCKIHPDETINLLWEKLCRNKLQSRAGIRNLFSSYVEQKREEVSNLIKKEA